MSDMKGVLQRFKAIKKIKLGKKRTGVIYRGEDGLFYAGVKTKEDDPQKTTVPEQESEILEDDDDEQQSCSSGSGSIWDKIIDKLGSKDESNSANSDEEESEAFRHSNEITPPTEWMPSSFNSKGEMTNDISDADAKQVAWDEEKKKEAQKAKKGNASVGTKPGDFISHPPPDEAEYNKIYGQCSSVIDQMKDKLKFEARPVTYRKRFIRQGSIMQDAIARAIPMSQAGLEVPNIYRRTVRRIELQDCYMVLLADLSGSMDSESVKKSFTVVSEACGQWIPDERFALYVFGTNYAKLKAFDEPYSKVRYRIGGIEQWRTYDGSGTVMHLPLKHILDYTRKVLPEKRQKVLITLSDWELSNMGCDSQTTALLREFIKRDWIVINLALGQCDSSGVGSSLWRARQYPGLAKPCNQFEDLPKIFFDIYKRISYDGMTTKTFARIAEKANASEGA